MCCLTVAAPVGQRADVLAVPRRFLSGGGVLQTVEGTVFAFDKDIQCVVVASPSAQPGSSHVKVLRLDFIQEVVSSKAPEKPFDSTLPAVDPKRVAAREAKALQVRFPRALHRSRCACLQKRRI